MEQFLKTNSLNLPQIDNLNSSITIKETECVVETSYKRNL